MSKPEHLFWFMEAVLEDRGYDHRWVKDFGHARIAAGARAVHHAGLYGREDFDLDVIYQLVATILPPTTPYLSDLKQIELDLEGSFLETYPGGMSLFNVAKHSGKRVFIVSDQYMPKRFLEALLHTLGIGGYEFLLLSGEEGRSKARGSLYETLLDRSGLDAADLMHVGDNPHVDVEVPRSYGIDAIQICQSLRAAGGDWHATAAARLPCLGSIATARYLHRRTDDRLPAEEDPVVDPIDFLGYTFYGPLLVYVAKWLVGKLEDGGIERLLLLARDGEGLSKVLSVLFPEFSDRIKYTHASRRVLVYASGAVTATEIERHYRDTMNSDMPVHDFLDVLSGRTADFSPLKIHFTDNALLSDAGVKSKLLDELARYLCDPPHTDRASTHRERIKGYYKEKAGGSAHVGIFDIGWRCNLQRSLQDLLGDDTRVSGFYIGSIYEAQVPKPLVQSDSFAFNNDYPSNVFEDVAPNIWALELIFSGTEQSIIDIVNMNGEWRAELEPTAPSQDHVRDFARRVQDGALRFVKDACESNRDLILSLADRQQGVTMMREFLARPSPSDAGALARFSWAANIDQKEGYTLVKAPEGRSRKALFEARGQSAWAAGFDALLTAEEKRGLNRYQYRVGLDKLIPLDETLQKALHHVRKLRRLKVGAGKT